MIRHLPSDDDPLLSVRDLRVTFGSGERTVHAVNGISYDLARGETLGVVGESGCGKSVSSLALMRLLPKPAAQIPSGEILVRRRGDPRPQRGGDARDAGQPDGDDLPGPDDLAEPGPHRRAPADRGPRGASQPQASRRDRSLRGAARAGRHPGGATPAEGLSAPVQRRHAAARDDRDRPRLRPAAAHRRRADHRARRDDPGPDPRPDAQRGRRARHRAHPHHP